MAITKKEEREMKAEKFARISCVVGGCVFLLIVVLGCLSPTSFYFTFTDKMELTTMIRVVIAAYAFLLGLGLGLVAFVFLFSALVACDALIHRVRKK